MIIKLRLGHWRFTFSFAPVVDVIGVNSKLPDGNHILMWDFDGVQFENVYNELWTTQMFFKLPNIYILNTGAPDHYIAYCFKRTPWHDAVHIISTSPSIDWSWFKWGMYRDHFTLRVTPKCNRNIKLAEVLRSIVPEDCSVYTLQSWVKYETLQDNWPYKEIFIPKGDK